MTDSLDKAAAEIAGAERLLLTCHRGPDGDALGSMVALASLLRARGRHATLYCPDLVPRHLKWLPHVKTLAHRLRSGSRYQVTIVVDCGDRTQLGPEFPGPEIAGRVIVLDHHASSSAFGDVYVCDPQAASVGVLVARLARHLGWELSHEAALALYVSLVSDTGYFRHANSNGEVFELATELVCRHGVDAHAVAERLARPGTLARCRLLAAALGTIELALADRVAFMTITEEMVRCAGASWEDSDGMVGYVRSLRGVHCGVLLTPAKGGGTRVSIRSTGYVHAGAICQQLGGGGHAGAAGCVLKEELPAARKLLERTLERAITAAGGGDRRAS